jgi:hypothetical protein
MNFLKFTLVIIAVTNCHYLRGMAASIVIDRARGRFISKYLLKDETVINKGIKAQTCSIIKIGI